MAMAPGSIVEHLDVFEDVGLCVIACSIDLLSDSLLLQAAEERLRNRVVPAISSTAHARIEFVCFAEADPVVASILRPLVRVHDNRLFRSSSPHSHQKCVQDDVSSQGRLHGPPDDHSTVKVHNGGQVQPAFPGPDVGDVRKAPPVSLDTDLGRIQCPRRWGKWFDRGG